MTFVLPTLHGGHHIPLVAGFRFNEESYLLTAQPAQIALSIGQWAEPLRLDGHKKIGQTHLGGRTIQEIAQRAEVCWEAWDEY